MAQEAVVEVAMTTKEKQESELAAKVGEMGNRGSNFNGRSDVDAARWWCDRVLT